MKHIRLWAACLALLPLAAYPVFAQAPSKAPSPTVPALTGPITKISIVGLKNISLDTVQAKLTLKPGDAYTVGAIAKDAAALNGIGVFQTVSVESKPAPPSGVDLIYTITEYPIVQGIQFTDTTPTSKPSVPAADLIAQMKTRVGQVLNRNLLVGDLQGLFNLSTGYYAKRGYFADVGSLSIDPKDGIITVPLTEYRIQSIQVTGNSRIKTEDILAQMHTKVGDIFDKNVLNNDEAAIFEMGQFRQVQPPVGQVSTRGRINVTIPVVEQAPATGTLDEKQGKVIPFLYDPITSPYPVVQVSVNGKPPLPFIVDTGTTAALSLNPWAAQQLGLKADGEKEKGIGFTSTKLPSQHLVLLGADRAHDVKLEAQTAQIVSFEFMDQAFPGQRMAGLIGLGLLAPITSCFDFAAKTLTLFTAPHPPLSTPGGIVLPLHTVSDGAAFAVRANLAPGTDADLTVDTGSVGTQIPLSALAALHPAAVAFAGGSIRIQGVYFGPDLRLTDLKIGSLDVPNAVVGTLPSSGNGDTSLGLDILAGYRLTLDGPNGQLTLEPSTKGGRYVYGKSRLDIKPAGETWSISEFHDTSPAQAAGLQLNDELVTVDGISVRGLSKLQVGHLISGIVGVPIYVQVRRISKEMMLSWMPVDEFSTPPDVMNGLAMDKRPGDIWVVLGLTKGCPGDTAGLLMGDKITQIDGEDTASLPLDRYSELFRKPTLVLQVERAGVAKPFTVRLTAVK